MLEELIRKVDGIAQEHTIPKSVLDEVKSRIEDWILSGGAKDSRYIENQFKVLDRFISYKIHKAGS